MGSYILGIDQSTQGTKALLFDEAGKLTARADLPHRQIINEQGWVEHDPEEIYANTILAVKNVVEKSGIRKRDLLGAGISNQRETSLVWNRAGKSLYNAIVWQDARAYDICKAVERQGMADSVRLCSGINLSPYFPAPKLAWMIRNVNGVIEEAKKGQLRLGTVDTFLIYRLTGGEVYKTDYSNASRTQLFNIRTLKWDEMLCNTFGIPMESLPHVEDSDGDYGKTDFEGFLDCPIPIRGVLGDSHGALFGQGCVREGMLKVTYGTGSSCMMNVGKKPVFSNSGLVSSLAWKISGEVNYVLEGNINYTGAVITWLQKDLGLIGSAAETEGLAQSANSQDHSYQVPAFSGLGAPYWNSNARALIYGMSRTTGKAELVRAALESIAYQITDIILAMQADAPAGVSEIRTDGGPTRNSYLMQFQSDIARLPVAVSPTEELSGMGAAYATGAALGLYDTEALFRSVNRKGFSPKLEAERVSERYKGWKNAVNHALNQ